MTITGVAAAALMWGTGQSYAQYVPPPQLVPGVDYSLPNYANSPLLTKFVDALPGTGGCNVFRRGEIPHCCRTGAWVEAGPPRGR